MNKSLPLALTVVGAAGVMLPTTAVAKTTKYTGATESYRYGTLSVTISVSKKKISTLSVSYSPSDPRSAQLDSVAVPELRQEALRSQSWDVHSVSGVSYTSLAFKDSLYSAMRHADLLKK